MNHSDRHIETSQISDKSANNAYIYVVPSVDVRPLASIVDWIYAANVRIFWFSAKLFSVFWNIYKRITLKTQRLSLESKGKGSFQRKKGSF